MLPAEAIEGLAIKESGIYIDGTFGRGGHSGRILQRLGRSGTLLAFDRDRDAWQSEAAQKFLQDSRFQFEHRSFSSMQVEVERRNWLGAVDGVLLDLGVSSPQLDNPERGFSFAKDGPLDMRMNADRGISAAQWLAETSETEIVRVLFEYGEERFARRIAAAIVHDRDKQPFLRTLQLSEMIARVVPMREKNKHPATRSFQAIRIAVNEELQELEQALRQAVEVLKPGGRLVVIAFHSLEDRIVKRFIRDESRGKYEAGRYPVATTEQPLLRLKKIGKAIKASVEEVKQNPRARSAVLRIAERRE